MGCKFGINKNPPPLRGAGISFEAEMRLRSEREMKVIECVLLNSASVMCRLSPTLQYHLGGDRLNLFDVISYSAMSAEFVFDLCV